MSRKVENRTLVSRGKAAISTWPLAFGAWLRSVPHDCDGGRQTQPRAAVPHDSRGNRVSWPLGCAARLLVAVEGVLSDVKIKFEKSVPEYRKSDTSK